MAGLIPLRLQPGSSPSSSPTNQRNSVMLPPSTSPSRPPRHTRQAASMSSIPLPLHLAASSPPRPSRPMRNSMMPSIPSLPVLPYTQTEWKKTMAEVKRQYMSRRFRACSTRCTEILENLKDTSSVEPAHLIYLHFYAANSLEMCARPFPSMAPARAQLLNNARKHYDQAAVLIKDAEAQAPVLARSSSRNSTLFSGSLHSPSGSISSGTWSTPTTASPTNSVCSFDDFVHKSCQVNPQSTRKAKKTVSFCLPKEETFKIPTEPYIRPDSPTLGFEDAYFSAPILSMPLPEPPKRAPSPVKPRPVEVDETMPRRSSLRRPLSTSSYHGYENDDAAHRYCETLSSLKAQLDGHKSDLDALLCEPKRLRKEEILLTATSAAVSPELAEELLAMDRHARIERLRQNGWQRKRFDPSRYERLCNDVLAELSW